MFPEVGVSILPTYGVSVDNFLCKIWGWNTSGALRPIQS